MSRYAGCTRTCIADAVGARVQRKSLNLTDVTVCGGKRGEHRADINSGMGTNTVGHTTFVRSREKEKERGRERGNLLRGSSWLENIEG